MINPMTISETKRHFHKGLRVEHNLIKGPVNMRHFNEKLFTVTHGKSCYLFTTKFL